ncbi:hypothetical protein ACULN0_03780 [Pectobacterium actinidiae]|uniref:hypothetical protein n=1 Tax=Pectobacterium actinidiae TaxID=1507808 RepID=UPI004040B4BF
MRQRELISVALFAAMHRDERQRMVASTVEIIAAAKRIRSTELSPSLIREHIELYERGWYILEERDGNNNLYYKKHNY